MLPALDGYSVLTAIRQHSISETIPFIFLTSKANRADIRRGIGLGADDYLPKPFEIEELLEAISIWLAKQVAFQRFYMQAPPANSLEQKALTADLESAIERSELSIHYQPQIDSQTQQIIGAESLLRW
jgi:DNA-binding response OmpR family regulator